MCHAAPAAATYKCEGAKTCQVTTYKEAAKDNMCAVGLKKETYKAGYHCVDHSTGKDYCSFASPSPLGEYSFWCNKCDTWSQTWNREDHYGYIVSYNHIFVECIDK